MKRDFESKLGLEFIVHVTINSNPSLDSKSSQSQLTLNAYSNNAGSSRSWNVCLQTEEKRVREWRRRMMREVHAKVAALTLLTHCAQQPYFAVHTKPVPQIPTPKSLVLHFFTSRFALFHLLHM